MGWKGDLIKSAASAAAAAAEAAVSAAVAGGKGAKGTKSRGKAGGKGGKGGKGLQCHCCLQLGHRQDQCTYQHEECKTCGGYGHRQFCKGNKAPPQPGGKGGAAANAAPVGPLCNCCGKLGHVKPDCRKKGEACSICGTNCHLKAVCSKRDNNSPAGAPATVAPPPQAGQDAPRIEWHCPCLTCKAKQYDAEAMKRSVCGAKREGKDDPLKTPKPPQAGSPQAVIQRINAPDVVDVDMEDTAATVDSVVKFYPLKAEDLKNDTERKAVQAQIDLFEAKEKRTPGEELDLKNFKEKLLKIPNPPPSRSRELRTPLFSKGTVRIS